MSRIKFRLQRLLDVRTRQADACKAKLAGVAQQLAAAEDVVRGLEEFGARLSCDWTIAANRGMSAWHAADFERARSNQVQSVTAAQHEAEKIRKEVIAARSELERALIQVKTLEKARENSEHRAEVEEQRKEQLVLDEFSILLEARTE
ncbi:MAG: flagellar FliJ family protein [Planctomycetota bacterium]